jgi:three-Cys-motif partner protein
MHVICAERNRKNFAALKSRLAGFDDCVTLHRGNFAKHRDAVLEQMGVSPALILLDPIGLKTIPAEACVPLLQRIGKNDVFIVLHFKVVHRTAGMLLETGHANPETSGAVKAAANLDATFNSPRWRHIALEHTAAVREREVAGRLRPNERALMVERCERKYVNLYFEEVLGSRYGYKCAFPVRRGYGTAVQYWLVHASDHAKPFELMNDEIVKLSELLLFRHLERDGGLPGLAEWDVEQHRARELRALETAVLAVVNAAPGGGIRFAMLREQLLDEFFGRVKWGAYAKVVKSLVRADKLQREERKAAAMRDNEWITVSTASAGDAQAASGAAA